MPHGIYKSTLFVRFSLKQHIYFKTITSVISGLVSVYSPATNNTLIACLQSNNAVL